MKYMKFIDNFSFSKFEKFFFVIFSLSLSFFFIKYAMCGVPSFDGAMNLQVPVNLLEKGIYATSYHQTTLFGHEIQTNGVVIFPMALMFKLFGISSESALFVNVFFVLFLFTLISYFTYKYTRSIWPAIFTIFVIINTKDFCFYSVSALGEVPILSVILLSLLFLEKYFEKNNFLYLILSGITYGLAYITKTVALIALPIFVLLFLSKIIVEKRKIRELFFFLISFIVPFLAFELYRCCLLGFDQYKVFWRDELLAIFAEAGVHNSQQFSFNDTVGLVEKLKNHLTIFGFEFRCRVFILPLILFICFLSFLVRIVKNRKIETFDFTILLAFIYFTWWLLITPTQQAWGRRILIGVILLEWNAVLLFSKFFAKIIQGRLKRLLLYICCFVFLYNISSSYAKVNYDMKNAFLDYASKIKKLKEEENAIFCGVDWWQSPRLSFYSNQQFCNLIHLKDKDIHGPVYLIVDHKIPDEDSLLSKMPYSFILVDKHPRYDLRIYKVDTKNWTPSFSTSEYALASESVGEKQSIVGRGVWSYEEGIRGYWCSKKTAILLRNGASAYKLVFNIPENVTAKRKSFEVKINDKVIFSDPNISSGSHELIINVPDDKSDYYVVRFETNFSISYGPNDYRAFVLNALEKKL